MSGVAFFDFFGQQDVANGIALQTDGKIVVAGYATSGGNKDFALTRFNSDGSPDFSFGSGSDPRVTTAIGISDDFGRAVAIQADGKIVVGGSNFNRTSLQFAVAAIAQRGVSMPVSGLAAFGPLIYGIGR